MFLHFKIYKKQIKIFFLKIIGGGMAPFGQGMATPMLSSISSKKFKYYGRNSVGIDISRGF